MNEEKKSRRDFLSKYTPIALIGSLVAWGGALARFTMPTLLPQETKKIKIGMPQDFPSGTVKLFTEDRVMLFADDDGIFAISTTCTHLGCVVTWNGRGFDCPCHGSQFAVDGGIIKGPAPKSLEWFKINRLPSGQLEIDLNSKVKPGTRESAYA